MNWPLINRLLRAVLAAGGFGTTWLAAINVDRLTAEGADAGPLDYGLRVLLPLLATAGFSGGRTVLRFFDRRRTALKPNAPMAPHLTALGDQIAQLTAQGNIAGARAVLEAAQFLNGGPKS